MSPPRAPSAQSPRRSLEPVGTRPLWAWRAGDAGPFDIGLDQIVELPYRYAEEIEYLPEMMYGQTVWLSVLDPTDLDSDNHYRTFLVCSDPFTTMRLRKRLKEGTVPERLPAE